MVARETQFLTEKVFHIDTGCFSTCQIQIFTIAYWTGKSFGCHVMSVVNLVSPTDSQTPVSYESSFDIFDLLLTSYTA
jgi:hypothetical protein